MADAETEDEPVKKRSKLPMTLGLVLALAGGGGGFYAVYSGMILGPPADEVRAGAPGDTETGAAAMALPDVAFVPLEPMVISLPGGSARHLRFTAQLEVPTAAKPDVELLLPRVVDVFNSYLRAVEVADLEKPTALLRFRSHLLRRAQLVLGDERVNNLLVMEFVVN
ncbi:flagellar basal body-associated FliL family protein [Marinovum sp.]|uniref:flagellar basal body-associated FliL family protein n=1 Tax=Marinovum sp. TaxID=2024839 RepID=UPI002B27480B|nr:flagellar basal body-associated FliL family protein [Marinovum sp.]